MLSFFPLDVLDEIWDLIESVSKGFFTYSSFWLDTLQDTEILGTTHDLRRCYIMLDSFTYAADPTIYVIIRIEAPQ